MAVDTSTYVGGFDTAKPAGADPKSEGDDNFRHIKTVLKTSFPNVTGAVTPTHTELNYVDGVTSAIQTQFTAKAPLASPTFTGTPAAPTAAGGTNTTQIATTAFVATSFAPIASPTLTGVPAAPTAAQGTNTTQLATTEFVTTAAVAAVVPVTAPDAGKYLTNNGTVVSWANVFASGTAMLFAQTAAPTGWTKSVTHDNKALRVVTGTASSGGTTNFTTVFASRTPSGTITGGDTTLTTAQIPAHTHTLNGNGTFAVQSGGGAYGTTFGGNTGSEGGGGSHSHTSTFAGTAMDFAVQYVDVIIATKD